MTADISPHVFARKLRAQAAERLGSKLHARWLWARYWATHEALRVPLTAAQRLAFALSGPRPPRQHALEVAVASRYRELLECDYEQARDGLYPAQLLFDLPLAEYLRELPRFLRDLPRVLGRVRARNHRDLPPGVALEQYPRYYRRTFHWQTDGYLSEHSAALYDLSVELLFVGCADVMRRQALAEVLRRRTGPLALLDVGAGTGRFLAQAAPCLPGSELRGVELSPWYARFAERRWAQRPETRGLRMTVANAEALPFAERSFDVVTSVFLLHELPRRVRRGVLEEMRRVLRPGGLLVLADAAQPSDAPELAPALRQFARDLHEPFFRDYQRDDLAELSRQCGFRVQSVRPHFFAKVLVAEL